MDFRFKIALALGLAAGAVAQPASPWTRPQNYTLAGKPAFGVRNRTIYVTDCESTSACAVGGGSTVWLFRDSGTAWGAAHPTGGGGGGGSGGGVISYSGNNLTLTVGTWYAPPGGGGVPATTEANSQVKAPSGATITNFQATTSIAPGSGNSYAITWRKAGADQSLTCTISGTATTCTDTTNSFSVSQGDLVSVKIVVGGTPVTTPMITWLAQWGTTGSNGTVNSGTSGNLAKYGATGTAVSEQSTAAGILTLIATPSSANLIAALTDETGTGAAVFATSPVLVTPALGTPSALVATNATGTAAGLTAGLATALAADPTDCSTNQPSIGINASGTANCMTLTAGLAKLTAGVASAAAFSDVAALTVPNVSNVTGQTTSQSTVTLATTPTAGQYQIKYIVNQNALCTTGNGLVVFAFNWTDAGNARTLTTGPLWLSTAQQTGGYVSGTIPIYVASGNVTYTSTVTTCATGTASYDIHAVLERLQ